MTAPIPKFNPMAEFGTIRFVFARGQFFEEDVKKELEVRIKPEMERYLLGRKLDTSTLIHARDIMTRLLREMVERGELIQGFDDVWRLVRTERST